jgi:hypothetical protein
VRALGALLACVVILHGPDGSRLLIQSRHLIGVREVTHDHVAKGSHAVVYTTDENWAVTETGKEVAEKLEHCRKLDP